MSKLEDLYKFEQLPIASIAHVLVKYYEFDNVVIDLKGRYAVESGVWMTVTMYKGKNTYYCESQRMDLLKDRLIKVLDNLEVRPKEFIKPQTDNT